MFSKILLTVFCINIAIQNVLADELPFGIKPCSPKDPNFEKCSIESGKAAFPSLLKGDKKLNIPVLSPLNIPEVSIDASKDLKIKLTDITINGIEKTDIRGVSIHSDKKNWEFSVFIPLIEILATYDINGKILVLPIVGNGPINITADDSLFKYSINYELIERGGKEYAKLLDNDVLDFKPKRVYFKLENLFNGDKKLGQEMNIFLNDNWEEVYTDIGGVIKDTIKTIVKTIASNLFKDIPYNDFFKD